MMSDNLEELGAEELAELGVVQLVRFDELGLTPRAWACTWCGWHRLERSLVGWRCERCHRAYGSRPWRGVG